MLAAINFAALLDNAINIMYVALGLGLVIFFHELGHFAVAKWCGVFVERFSIGFGPILWATKRGDTEYALSAIPFGGYVKMMGQDDIDPSQLSSEQIAEDPRSYSSKSVWQRMGIISAGVIMNIVTGVMFFAIAFQLGLLSSPAGVGFVQPGMPAWKAGVEQGDIITTINGRKADSFEDILRGVALTTGTVDITGVHRNGEKYSARMLPDMSTRRMIGVGPQEGLQIAIPSDVKYPIVDPDTPAAAANPPLRPGDIVKRAGDVELSSYADLQDIFAEQRDKPLDIFVEREGSDKLLKVQIGPNRFRTLGLRMDIEQISAIVEGSPAALAGLKVGDKIAAVGDEDVGIKLDPLELPDYFASLHGQDVKVKYTRQPEGEGGPPVTKVVTLKPLNKPGWVERPFAKGAPLSIPAIGVAYHITAIVLKVVENSPAAEAGIIPGERIRKMQLTLADGAPIDRFRDKTITFDFEKDKDWATAFWTMQSTAGRTVTLTVSHEGKTREVEIIPRRDETREFFAPWRGIAFAPQTTTLVAASFPQAISMGVSRVRNTVFDIYLTLRNLIGGALSPKELHGPIGIAQVAYAVAKEGPARLLSFLGFLSINLAVLNFLPIPVLDGGHMVFLCWEAVTRRKPSERVLIAATYCGMAFVLGLMLFVIYLDIFVHQMGI